MCMKKMFIAERISVLFFFPTGKIGQYYIDEITKLIND